MSVRPLQARDLPAMAALYAELDRRDPALPVSGYEGFFRRVLLEPPLADPEIPSLVFDDPEQGVVAVLGAHARPFVFAGRPVRLACGGPLIVHPDHRARGLGAVLLRRFAAGPQDATFNDRMIEEVEVMWKLLGGTVDATTSTGWSRTLSPLAAAACRFAHRHGRQRLPGGTALAPLGPVGRRRPRRPPGAGAPLEGDELRQLVGRLDGEFRLRPAYDDRFLGALWGAMDSVVLGDRVARIVRSEEGVPVGAYAMFVMPGGFAELLAVIAAERDAGLVLDHAFHEAATRRAVEVRGRVEPHLLPYLRERDCRTGSDYATLIHSEDADLVDAVLAGDALLNRFDGEWWMRPRPNGSKALGLAPTVALFGSLVAELPI